MTARPHHVNYTCKCKLAKTNENARLKITKMDAVENGEECLLATSYDYGQTILIIQLSVALFTMAALIK